MWMHSDTKGLPLVADKVTNNQEIVTIMTSLNQIRRDMAELHVEKIKLQILMLNLGIK